MADCSDAEHSGTCGENLSWRLTEKDHKLIISGSGELNYWISGEQYSIFERVEMIELPDGLTKIGDGSLSWFEKVRDIKIPETVESIGECAFACCKSLKTITIPASVTSIGDRAFAKCYSLKTISIPASVTSIGDDDVFSDCKNLEKIDVDQDNSNYASENGMLFNKDKTILIRCPPHHNERSVSIPDTVKTIGSYAFCSCSEIESVFMPDSVETIGVLAFGGCIKLRSIHISNSVKTIDSYAFDECRSLKEIIIPSSVEKLSWVALAGCEPNTTIINYSDIDINGTLIIPEGVKIVNCRP